MTLFETYQHSGINCILLSTLVWVRPLWFSALQFNTTFFGYHGIPSSLPTCHWRSYQSCMRASCFHYRWLQTSGEVWGNKCQLSQNIGGLQATPVSHTGPWTWNDDTNCCLSPVFTYTSTLLDSWRFAVNGGKYVSSTAHGTPAALCCQDTRVITVLVSATPRITYELFFTIKDHQRSFGQSALLTITGLRCIIWWCTPPLP